MAGTSKVSTLVALRVPNELLAEITAAIQSANEHEHASSIVSTEGEYTQSAWILHACRAKLKHLARSRKAKKAKPAPAPAPVHEQCPECGRTPPLGVCGNGECSRFVPF